MKASTEIGANPSSPKTLPLPDINARIHAATDRIGDAVENLSDHADRVFGPLPACGQATDSLEVEPGVLGDIDHALWRLERIAVTLNAAVSRTCTLA